MIFLNIVILIIGFVALVKGADIFVDGSSSLAKIFKVPPLIIGLTIVALGTSMPELAVSTSAALAGANEIALSNVVGSNIFNLLGVLGVCSVIHSVPVDSVILKRDFPISIVITIVIFISIALQTSLDASFFSINMQENAGTVKRFLGIVLLIIFVAYIAYLIFDARKNPVQEEEKADSSSKSLSLWKSILFIILGLSLIIAGGKAVVYAAQKIAEAAGMTETLIALTVIAIGTSLPELVTSIVAARKGETSLAMGNVIGSNILNLLFILGVSVAIHPVAVNVASVYDLAILILVSFLTWIFSISKRRIVRAEGIFMLLCYVAETIFAILR